MKAQDKRGKGARHRTAPREDTEGGPPGAGDEFITPDQEVPESGPGSRPFTPIDAGLGEWLALHDADARGYTAQLYRVDQIDKRKHWLVRSYSNETPTADMIGAECGPGTYKLMILLPKGNNGARDMKAVNVYIDDSFRSATAPGQAPAPGLVAQAAAPGGTMTETLAVLAGFVRLIAPLVNREHSPGDPLVAAQVAQYQNFNQLLAHQARENVRLYSDLTREALAAQDQDEGDEVDERDERQQDNGGNGVSSWLPLIAQFAPLILGKGPGADAAAEMVRALPQYAEVKRDRAKYAALVKAVEKTLGKAKARALVDKLK